ncbi:acyltransferase family protein [Pseudomonas sp. OIL-1]|uniref:acyltransferase family protein n=1 Tax=Pseudomonas sp. OIL-1 TaxID=2706126 RepID=UPI0013A77B64|nr:acyltransferase family protein [Pseudomonas sp. OIL-1]QIB52693.1 acyltransferase [Pseudomonas sp. OIL-1]
MTPTKTFRDDINGLRAWAVVSVILFHFHVPGFAGGFVGVDIFFVISGFLMTGIIIRGLEKPRSEGSYAFSLIGFYLARGVRIIPALLVLCLTLLAIGWFFLPTIEYRSLGVHSTSALGFLSNFKFWAEAGYFDTASHEKWLLHTWSLSVEWQFYLVLPLILMLVWKLAPGRKAATLAAFAVFVISLALSVFISRSSPGAAFYLLHTRAWEMLAGGLVFLLADRLTLAERSRQWLYGAGFALIALSIAAFDSTTVWPGWKALVPVLGTAMVLVAARQKALLSGHALIQRIGDWSYSLYLWHWPLAVALVYLGLQGDTTAIICSLILTLLCGWLSFRFVEGPTRSRLKMPMPVTMSVLACVTVLAAAPGVGIYLQNGVPGRLSAEVEGIFAEAQNRNPRMEECHAVDGRNVPGCTYGGETLGAIVIGDSHAASVVRSVEKALPSEQLHVLDWTLNTCQTIRGIKKANDPDFPCGPFIEQALLLNANIEPHIPLIIVNRLSGLLLGQNEVAGTAIQPPNKYVSELRVARDETYRDEMKESFVQTVCEFSKTRKVFILGPTPELILDVPKTMGRAAQLGKPMRVSITTQDYLQRHQYALDTLDLAVKECGAHVLDPTPFLCDELACYGDEDGLPLYYDDDHLNERGGSRLIPLFESVFTEPADGPVQASVGQDQ